MFQINEKIICINDSISQSGVYELYQQWVIKDQEYTVRSCTWDSINNCYRVLLNEVFNKPTYIEGIMAKVEPGFSHKRFASQKEIEVESYIYEREGVEV